MRLDWVRSGVLFVVNVPSAGDADSEACTNWFPFSSGSLTNAAGNMVVPAGVLLMMRVSTGIPLIDGGDCTWVICKLAVNTEDSPLLSKASKSKFTVAIDEVIVPGMEL